MVKASDFLKKHPCLVGATGFFMATLVAIWMLPIVLSAVFSVVISALSAWALGAVELWQAILAWSGYTWQMNASILMLGCGVYLYSGCWVCQAYDAYRAHQVSYRQFVAVILWTVVLSVAGSSLMGMGVAGFEGGVFEFWKGFGAVPVCLALFCGWLKMTE